MKRTTYFISIFLIVAVVSTITVFTSYKYDKTLLFAPDQYGTVRLSLETMVNVIIVDTDVKAGVPDEVNFGAMQRSIEKDTTTFNPKPFIIMNEGNVRANVAVCADSETPGNTPLFSSASSVLKFSIAQAYPAAGWTTSPAIDDCNGNCYVSAYPTCTLPEFCNVPYAACSSDAGLRQTAISSMDFVDSHDEAFMHIKIMAAGDEPAGSKQTIVTVFGSAA